MKYNKNNKPIKCYMRQSDCYKGTSKMTIKGILWHSTGANNPNLKRYVQPDDNAADRKELLKLIGENLNKNDWNHIRRSGGMNCWIGKLADGTVSTIQTMPWNYRPWGCGSGKNGSCNSGWIQFEICEDGLTNRKYFEAVYKEAVEITAYLCDKYGLNPHGTVKHGGVNVPVILCHADSHKLGLGINHVDIYHWFSKYGKDMDDVRNDVAALLNTLPEDKKADAAIKEWQEAAVKDGFTCAVSGYWNQECETVAAKAVIRKREGKYLYKNLTKIVQRAVGVKIDGYCGIDTDKAIKKYQKANGLTVDGCCGVKTWKKILKIE